MRLHFLTVPIHESAGAEAEVNQFLGSHRVVAIDRQLVIDGGRSAWALCITYTPGDTGAAATTADPGKKGRLDYRELLPAADFQVFAKLRELRKQIAEREGLPPYALFTNEQLAEMARRRVSSLAELGTIAGVGQSRLDKYGRAFLEILAAAPAGAAQEQRDAPPQPH